MMSINAQKTKRTVPVDRRMTQYPDKYGVKYSDTPAFGTYDVEKADK